MSAHEAAMLLLLTVGAFVVPLAAERLRLFAAPCEVLYGALVVAILPDAMQPGEFVSALSNFGLLLLLFLAGLEIDFALMQRQGPRVLLRAAGIGIGIQVLAVGLGLLLHWPLLQVLVLGVMSVSVLLVILRQEGLHSTPFGQLLLIAGAIGEFLSILELTGYDLIHRNGFGWPLALAAIKLIGLLVLGYLALRLLRVAIVRRPERFGRLVATHDPLEVGVRAALALMLCFAAVAVLLDVEQILATFIAGMICSFGFQSRNALTEKMMTLGQGFFLPIFFISVGMGLDVRDLVHGASLVLMLELLAGVLLTRLLAVPLLRMAGLSWSRAGAGALLLAAPLTLQVAVVKVGVDLGEFPGTLQGVVLGACIAGAFVFPLLARALVRPPQFAWYARLHRTADAWMRARIADWIPVGLDAPVDSVAAALLLSVPARSSLPADEGADLVEADEQADGLDEDVDPDAARISA